MNSIRHAVDPAKLSDNPEVQAMIDAYRARAHRTVGIALALGLFPGAKVTGGAGS